MDTFLISDIPEDDQATFELLATGKTLGTFQLESHLGKHWCKTLKPENIEHIAALVSILRPGCLNSKDENKKSVTEHYCERKNGNEPVTYLDDSLAPILDMTYGLNVFQEQSMKIAQEIAGFTMEEADTLRKCVTGDTRFVSKTRGWISIDQLLKDGYQDDLFLVMNEQGQTAWKKIEKIWSTGRHDVRQVTTSAGMYVKATKYHQFLTNHGWKARMKLSNDDYIVCAKHIHYDGKDDISPELAIIIAGLITEGHFVDEHDATFVNHDEYMMAIFSDAFQAIFHRDNTSKDKKVFRIFEHEKRFINKYLQYGKSATKRLPQIMMGMTFATTAKFLSFMLAAEGGCCERNNSFEFTSKSKDLIHQIQLLLLRFGIRSYIRYREIENYGIFYRLFINDIEDHKKLLNNLTSYWPNNKKATLQRMVTNRKYGNYTTDIVPSNIIQQCINQYPYIANYEGGSIYSQPLSRKRFARLCQATNDDIWMKIAQGKQQYLQVDNLLQLNKQQETYDFTIEGQDTPFIIANGLIIHNSIGKKLPKLMAELESKFMDGCKKEGKVSEEVAKQLWENIKASQRYSFNKSHAVSYGLTSYRTAYCKAHYPLEFYCAYLRGAEWKQHPLEEINALVNDAKLSGIKVELPDFRSSEPTFFIDGEVIRFGLGNIKQVGEASRDKLLTAIRDASDNTSWSWFKYLIRVADNISSTTNVALISCGALDSLGESRTRMLYELEIWDKVTNKEKEWIQGREFSTLTQALTQCASHKKFGGGCANEKRVNIMLGLVRMLENPPYELIDNPNWISWAEEKYLGVAISCNKVDACNEALKADATCQQFVHGVMPCAVLAVEVKKVKMVRTKNGENPGQKMAFLDIADSTATIEGAVCFPDKYRQHMNILYEGNTVLVQLERGNRGAIIKDCSQI